MLNNVQLSGRLAQDVKFKTTANGLQIAQFNIAVQRNHKNQQGEYDADFFRVIAFRSTAEVAANYLKKGDRVNVAGRLQQRSFENDEGQRITLVEVVVENLDLIGSNNQQNTNSQQPQQQQSQQQNYNQQQPPQQRGQNQNGWQQNQQQKNNPFANANNQVEIEDDDLPFDFKGQEGGDKT